MIVEFGFCLYILIYFCWGDLDVFNYVNNILMFKLFEEVWVCVFW